MKALFTYVFTLAWFVIQAQEVIISPLSSNPELTKAYESGLISSGQKRLNSSLFLPFIDDFSRNHQPGSPEPLWEDNFAFINPTFGVDPPTIGVATFDGLDYTGYPYDFVNPENFGVADYLTSCVINLKENADGIQYQLSDSIILSFYYQAEGNGFPPKSNGKLILEFYDADLDIWFKQWEVEGGTLEAFKPVFVPVTQERFLHEDFQFRFKNEGRLSGNLDHWHIDVVYMDKNRSSLEVGFPDLSYQYPINNLLANYTSIPYKHFKTIAASYMGTSVDARLRNNSNVAVNVQSIKLRNYSQGVVVNEAANPSQVNNISALTSNDYPITFNGGGNNYVYDTNIDSPFVSFYNEMVVTPGSADLISENDTIGFTQYFENYYAYDDGSAEAGIGLVVQGGGPGELALKYQALQADSLIAMKINFNPSYEKPVDPFVMLIYGADGGTSVPGAELYSQGFNTAQFNQEGYDVFSYYFFEEPVYVAGEYFVAIRQIGTISLNIGFDRNIDNTEKTYYKTGISWNQLPSSIPGSMMIRPVFQSEMDSIILGLEPQIPLADFSIYPNPANETFSISTDDNEILDAEVYTISGQRLVSQVFQNRLTFPVDQWPAGFYLVKVSNQQGAYKVKKLVINR